MKKTLLIVLGIFTVIFATVIFFVVQELGNKDTVQKIEYFKDTFKEETSHFENCPSDAELKKLFSEHKDDYKKLHEMAVADGISTFTKTYVFHKDGAMFYPYIIGEFPGDKKITRDRFFKYLELMNQCKVKSIASEEPDYSEAAKDTEKGTMVETESDKEKKPRREGEGEYVEKPPLGYQFELYYGYDATDKSLKDWVTRTKDIYYWNDDERNVVADTDKQEKLVPGKTFTQEFRLEPHWYISKKVTLEESDETEDSKDSEESKK